ncbi:unnamed protein product [Schistosoma curassoni]|nr:unnamed protein product [Schistosoma curassoni]
MSQEKQWTEVFHAIDKDKNGFLTREEIAQCLKEVGVCPNVADKIIKETDMNSDGKISLEEYLNALRKLPPREKCVARWNEVFQSIDKDGSGKVSIKELDEFLKSSGMDIDQKSLHNWMTQNDKNKDGELDYDEFLAYSTIDSQESTTRSFPTKSKEDGFRPYL